MIKKLNLPDELINQIIEAIEDAEKDDDTETTTEATMDVDVASEYITIPLDKYDTLTRKAFFMDTIITMAVRDSTKYAAIDVIRALYGKEGE